MAAYRTHLAGGTLAGLALGINSFIGGSVGALQLALVVLAGTAGGLVPDLDHDSSLPSRFLFTLAAAAIPALLLYLLPLPGLTQAALLWLVAVLLIRFPLQWLFQACTVHRGIFHSLPGLGIFVAGLYLLFPETQPSLRVAVAQSAALGYGSHLLLDHVSARSFEDRLLRRPRRGRSPFKLVGASPTSTMLAWGLLALLVLLIVTQQWPEGP